MFIVKQVGLYVKVSSYRSNPTVCRVLTVPVLTFRTYGATPVNLNIKTAGSRPYGQGSSGFCPFSFRTTSLSVNILSLTLVLTCNTTVTDDEMLLVGPYQSVLLCLIHVPRRAPCSKKPYYVCPSRAPVVGTKLKGVDLEAAGSINGVPVLEVEMESFEEKPWRKPGVSVCVCVIVM